MAAAAPSSAIPASVIKAGLEAVYGLRTSAGVRNAPNKVPGRDALPNGVTLHRQGAPEIHLNKVSVNFDRWDFSGWSVWVDTDLPVTFTDCLFRPAPRSGQYLIYGGHGSGGKAPMTFTRCTLDGQTELLPGHGPGEAHPEQVLLTTYGAVTLTDCALINLSNNAFNWDGEALTMTGCFIDSPGQKVFFSTDPTINAHVEAINISGGRVIIDRCLFDCDGGDARANAYFGKTGGCSSLIFWQARNDRVIATITNSLILPRKLAMYYTMQLSDDRKGVELTMTNNVIQRATAPNGPPGSGGFFQDYGVRVFKGSGNLDFVSGKLIPGRINGDK